MRRLLLSLFACSIVLASGWSARAAVFHVAPGGDDLGPGSAAQPWATIAKANTTLAAGDEVLIHAGTYDDSIRPVADGTADDNRIVYRAAGDGDVILTGFPGTGGPDEGALALGEKQYVTVSGRAPGDPVTAQRIRLSPQEDINSLGNVCGSEGVVVENIYAECPTTDRACNRGFLFCVGFWPGDYESRYNVLRDSTLIGVSDPGTIAADYTEDIVTLAHRSHHNLIEGNLLLNCRHSALYADSPGSHSNVIRNNRIYNPEHTALSIHSAGVALADGARFLVEGNDLAASGETVEADGGPGNALQWGSDELIIRYNLIREGGSVDTHATSIGGLIGATSTSFGAPYFATDGRVFHNTIADNRGPAVGMFDYTFDPVDLGRHVFANNVFYGSDSDVSGSLLAIYWDTSFVTADRYVRNVWGRPGGASTDEVISNAHNGSATLADAIATWSSPRDPDLTPWAGYENVYDALPGFADYANGDYRLVEASPYVDSAAPLTRVAAADTGAGTTLVVDDARFFYAEAGSFPAWMGVSFEWIAVGASFATSARVQLTGVDDATGELTLSAPISRQAGDFVWIWRDSTGAERISGAGPDIGSFERSEALFTDGFESGDASGWSLLSASPSADPTTSR